MKKSAPEWPVESPVPFHTGSNGEVEPRPVTPRDRAADAMFHRLAADNARRLGMPRRDFVTSAMGTATALFVINQAYGCTSGGTGARGTGGFDVDAGMMLDAGACEALRGDQFIFDVQTHHVNPNGSWRAGGGFEGSLNLFPQARCGEVDFVDCFDADHYIREVFVNSETAVAVLSQVPAVPGDSPLETEEAAATREIINRLADSERLIIHGIVLPERGAPQLDGMQALKEEQGVAAWKVYTPFQGGWRLDDEAIGIPFIEKARELDVRIICAHKGLSQFGLDPAFSTPADIGVVAPSYPDVNFLVYHSGYELNVPEGPYNPDSIRGVDTLVRAVLDNGIGKQGNVYAELGSTWRFVLTDVDAAGHVLGKLLLHLGEDRILWGTDSIWYGTPQDQIDAFRAFQIPQRLQDEHGYPPLTDTAKAKILGLNAAGVYGIDVEATRCAIAEDDVALAKQAIENDPSLRRPSHRRAGPQNRREFLKYLKLHEDTPG